MAPPGETSLDPANWDELRALGHRMVDDMLDYLAPVRSRPAWRSVPADVRARLAEPPPLQPTPPQDGYEQVQRDVLPPPTGHLHPPLCGRENGTRTPHPMRP